MATGEVAHNNSDMQARVYASLLQKADVNPCSVERRELVFLRSPSVAEAAMAGRSSRYSSLWNKHQSEHFSSEATRWRLLA
jgi:hypothetical protein